MANQRTTEVTQGWIGLSTFSEALLTITSPLKTSISST